MPNEQTMIYNPRHPITVENFESDCKEMGLNPEAVIFIFPGNKTHHKEGTTPFTHKSGGGLAHVSALLGEKKYPTLSLPTTNMANWAKDRQTKATVDAAIADLYRAVGLGYSLMLPVRTHQNDKYFQSGLADENAKNMEPSFWGNIEFTPNKDLGNYYIDELNKLAEFMRLNDEERSNIVFNQEDTKFNPLFKKMYLEGFLGKQIGLETALAWAPVAPEPSGPKAPLAPEMVPNALVNWCNYMFDSQLQELNVKLSEFGLNSELSTAATTLYHALKRIGEEFFKAPITEASLKTFNHSCDKVIKAAEETFKNHRGFGALPQFAKWVTGFFATLTVLPAIIVACKSKQGYLATFFGKTETDTSVKVANFKTELGKLQTALGNDSKEQPGEARSPSTNMKG